MNARFGMRSRKKSRVLVGVGRGSADVAIPKSAAICSCAAPPRRATATTSRLRSGRYLCGTTTSSREPTGHPRCQPNEGRSPLTGVGPEGAGNCHVRTLAGQAGVVGTERVIGRGTSSISPAGVADSSTESTRHAPNADVEHGRTTSTSRVTDSKAPLPSRSVATSLDFFDQPIQRLPSTTGASR